MSNVALEIQKSVYATLSGDAPLLALLSGNKIYDFVPDNTEAPYVRIGESEFRDSSANSVEGFEGTFTIDTWHRPEAQGRAPVLEIMQQIRSLLHRKPSAFTLTEHRMISVRQDFQTTLVEPDAVTIHGVQRFNFVIIERCNV